MIRIATKVQLLIFALITVIGITYVGANYVGINPLNGPYTVHLRLPASGGVFPNADVSERGVVVGKVAALHIVPSGVIADLKINHGEKIPLTGLTATVANLSAVGEEYVELEPTSAAGPYLKAGHFLPTEGTIPVDDATILLNLKNLLGSVNVKDLSTVVKVLGQSFADLGPTLQGLIDNGTLLTQSAINALPATLRLVDDGRTVLDTQNDVAAELKSFAASFSDLTGEVAGKDPALRGVLTNGVLASKQLDELLQENAPVLPALLNNLNTFTGIQDVRLPQVRTVLELYPAIVGDAFYALPKPGANGISTARFGQVTDPGRECATGYSSTKTRQNVPSGWGGTANLDAYCHGDNAAIDAQGVNFRGSRYTPRPAGDHANVTNSTPYDGPHYGQPFPGSGPVGACGTPSCPSGSKAKAKTKAKTSSGSGSNVIAVPYNPNTGLVEGLDGKLYELGLNGPVAPAFGSSSYTWLLLAPTMR
jgi:phospholipid/cholesterol/gamma-HCH transport system substrate-binding protein